MRPLIAALVMMVLLLLPVGAGHGAVLVYYSFDDEFDVGHDDSNNLLDLTLNGDAQWTSAAAVGTGALTLDGNGDYGLLAGGLPITNVDFSTSWWTRRATTGDDYVMGQGDGDATRNTLHIGFRDADTFTMAFWGDDLNYDNSALADTTEYHNFVCTYELATNTQTLYLDGFEVASRTTGGPFTGSGTNDLWVGSIRNAANQFAGEIDEFTVYDTVLTQAEVYAINGITELTWDKTTAQVDGIDWRGGNWLTPPPDYPNDTTLTIMENDGGASADFNLANVTQDEQALILRMTAPGPDPDTGNYVWLRRTTGWDAGLGVPDDTFGSLTIGRRLEAGEANNFVVMDQGTSLSTGTDDAVLSGLLYFGSDTHPGPDGAPGGGDDVTIPIEPVVVNTPANLTILHSLDDATFGDTTDRKFIKQGAGTLSIDSTSATMTTANTIFRIEDGVLDTYGADPLGGAPKVELAGGTWRVAGVGSVGAGPGGATAVYGFNALTADDTSGNANHGALEGGAVINTANGIAGAGLGLDGSNDLVRVAGGLPLSNNAFTISAWVRRARTGDEWFISQGDTLSTDQALHVGFRSSTRFTIGFWGDDLEYDMSPVTGEWHHWAAVYDDTTSEQVAYLDGVEVDREGSNAWAGSAGDFIMGRRNDGGQWFGGSLDEIYVYTSVLDPGQIAAMAVFTQALDLSTVAVDVVADSAMEVGATGTVPVGPLTLYEGVLRVEGTPDLVQFASTEIPSGRPAPVGVDLQAPVSLGTLNANSDTVDFIKRGPHNLSFETANATLGSTNFTVEEGTVVVVDPSSSVGTANFTLTGIQGGKLAVSSSDALAGTITIDGEISVGADLVTLQGSYYDMTSNPPTSILDPIDGPGGLLTMTPTSTRPLDRNIDFPGSNQMNTYFGDPGDEEQYSVSWVGQITVAAGSNLEPGPVSFATASDDGTVVYIDLNQDGDFFDSATGQTDPGEYVLNNNFYQGRTARNDSVDLAEGTYLIGFGYYEGGGGDNFSAQFGEGSGLGYNAAGMQFVDPTDPNQAGIWSGTPVVGKTLMAGAYGDTGVAGDIVVSVPNLTNLEGILVLDARDGYSFLLPGAVNAPDGGIRVTEGHTEVQGAVHVATLELMGGTMESTGEVSASKSLVLLSDSLNTVGQAVPPVTPTTNVLVGNGQTLVMDGPFSALGLELNGLLGLVGVQDVTVTDHLTVASTLNVSGTLTTTGADVTLNSGQLSATSALEANTVEVNDGTFSAAAALTTAGDLAANGGVLNVGGPLSVGGVLQAAGGTINAADTASSAGATEVSAGELNAASTLSVGGNLAMSGGTANVGDTLTIAGDLTSTGGALNASGPVTAATATVAGTGEVNLMGADMTAPLVTLGGSGVLNTGANQAVMSELQIGAVNYQTDIGTFTAAGDNVAAQTNLTVSEPGSVLTIQGPPGTTPIVLDPAEMTLTGSATLGPATDSDRDLVADELRLTDNVNSQTGAAYFNTKLPVDEPFTCVFDYQVVAGSGNLADGAAFVLQNMSATAMGGGGGSRGYLGGTLSPSVALLIDNWAGGSGIFTGKGLQLGANGNALDPPGRIVVDPVNISTQSFPNNVVHFRLEYDGVDILAIQLEEEGTTNVYEGVFTVGDLSAALGDVEAWVGFTGATGGENSDQRITNFGWSLPGSPPSPLDIPGTKILVTNDATLDLVASTATLGGLTVGGGAQATVTGTTDLTLMNAGGDGTIVGNFTLDGMFSPGSATEVGTLNVDDVVMVDGTSGVEWGLGDPDSDAVNVGELTVEGFWTLVPLDKGAAPGTYDPNVEYLVVDYTTIVGDPLLAPGFNLDLSEHFIWQGGLPTLVHDAVAGQILVKGLEEVLELQWLLPGDGSYNVAANWLNNALPDGVDATARFLENIGGLESTVTVDSPVTVGTIMFRSPELNPEFSYTLTGPEAITMATSVGDPQIIVQRGSHTVEAPLVFTDLTVDTAAGTGLTLVQPGKHSGNVTKTGEGTLELPFGNLMLGSLQVDQGTVQAGDEVFALKGGPLSIGGEGTLEVGGEVNRRVFGVPGDAGAGVPGARLVITGSSIGLLGETDGWTYTGALEVGANMLGLKDADEAPLYGAHIEGGTISSFNGIRLLPINVADGLNSRLYGFGTVNGNVVAGIQGNPTPAVVVADPGQTIEFTGVVQTGNSTFIGNVSITGTERLGFSPAVGMKLGGAPIGPDAVVEVYGTAGADFESETPDALAPPVADPVSGYGQFYVAGGESLVSGKITLSTGGSDYVGRGGDTFELIVTGQAWLMDFTQFPPQNVLLPEGSVNIDPGFIVDTSGIPLASPGLFWQEFRSDQGLTLKIVPEPGTLVLLLTGGLGLLLLVWRRRQS